MDAFDKPAGGWTEAAGLTMADVSFEDSISEEFFELEREAVFRRSWLHVGREMQIPNPGDYFTRELPTLNVSLILARGQDNVVRAFHNICSHRGNKLVWDDNPRDEVCGTGRRFTCKYHGWQYSMEGDLKFVNMENWFSNFDKCDYGLVPVSCDTWEGFIFVNVDPNPRSTLKEFLGDLGAGLTGYPFHAMTQRYSFSCEVNANWKLFEDAFQEQYHATTLHHKIIDQTSTAPMPFAFGSHFEILGRHSVWSVAAPQAAIDGSLRPIRPMESLFEANLWGPLSKPDIGLRELPKYVNVTRHPNWTNDVLHFYPNFDVLIWEPGWFLTYGYWPVAADRHFFEARMYFPPPKTASDRLAQELTAVEFKEFCFQDANTLEATHSMLAARVRSKFPLCDEEVQVRNNHKSIQDAVEAYKRELATNGNGGHR
jgi:phenylpropionate dioxygenase-like ring-hydroxylating dioxygenase large terminal subunit